MGGATSKAPPGPLDGVRVLDLAIGPLGAIGRTLAELGAEVLRIEPRQGGADRTQGRSVAGVGVAFAAANIGKRGVALDLDAPKDRERFEALAREADILIETTEPGSAAAKQLDVAGLRQHNPALVVLSVSAFGADGYRGWQATDLVLHALSGELSRSGVAGRAPLAPPGELATQCAAAQGAYIVLVAYMNRLQTGLGDHLDLSMLDAASQALDPGYGIHGSATAGVPASLLPRGRPEAGHQYPIVPCADGFVRLCILAPRQWQGMFELMGRPDEFADPSFNKVQVRFGSRTLMPFIKALFATKTRAELEAAGERHGVPIGPLFELDEALTSAQTTARAAFKMLELAPGVSAPFLNGVLEIDGARASATTPPPRFGEHQKVAFKGAPHAPPPAQKAAERCRPLAGLRVLDLGVIVVGAEQGRLLADYGADVIKVENAAFPDGSRQSRNNLLVSISFAAGHRNKRSLGLNLRTPEGRALFLKLVAQADVLLSNFKPGTLESLGLDYATLSEINPRLITADSSAFGASGPWSRRMGYGPLVRASAGLTAQWCYAGEPGSFSDAMTVYPDHVAARIGIIGVLALLVRRLRTGRGGAVSVSQTEVMMSHMAAQIAERALSKAGVALEGAPQHDAPWGLFPCGGKDEWCVVTVRDDRDWAALCGAIARPDLTADPALATAQGRAAQRQRINAALEAWLALRESREAMAHLQAAGVPAGAMLRVSELPEFEYFQHRKFFRLLQQAYLDEPVIVDYAPVRSERLADPPLTSAPASGEHTVEIMRELLGLDPNEIQRLIEEKTIELMPAPDKEKAPKAAKAVA